MKTDSVNEWLPNGAPSYVDRCAENDVDYNC